MLYYLGLKGTIVIFIGNYAIGLFNGLIMCGEQSKLNIHLHHPIFLS